MSDNQFQILDEINLLRSMVKGEKKRHIDVTNKKVAHALQEHLDDLRKRPTFDERSRLFVTQRGSRFQALS